MIEEHLRQKMLEQLNALKEINFRDSRLILEYARLLRNHSFKDVTSLGFTELLPTNTYNDEKRKGGLGNLLEEHYFGYTANSLAEPDFKEAGVELKVSPIEPYQYSKGEQKGRKTIKAGERLVLSMIPNDKEVAAEYKDSDLAKKSNKILLVNYERDRSAPSKDEQIIKMVNLFSPSEEDLKIIEDDYRIIASYIREGRAHELSEGLTKYLGAATKGATAEKSLRKQFYPFIGENKEEQYILAKSRAFSFKQSYVTALVQRFKDEQDTADKLVQNTADLEKYSFEELAVQKVQQYVGRSALQIRDELAPELELTTSKGGINKAAYRILSTRILGSQTGRIEEFEKANITVRVVRLNRKSRPDEDTKLGRISLSNLSPSVSWDESEWYEYLTTPRYMFIVYQEDDNGNYLLRGSFFWSMPMSDIGGEDVPGSSFNTAYGYWQDAIQKAQQGVRFTRSKNTWSNDFLNGSEHPVCHLRPSSQKAAYRFKDGTEIGNVDRDADRLPDGQYMTRQALWLNKDYIRKVIESSGVLG